MSGFSMETPQLSQEDFDKLFEAESKKLRGDETLHKQLGREGYPEPKAVETQAQVQQEEQQEEVQTEEAAPPVEEQTETESATTEEVEATTEGTDSQTTEPTEWLAALDPKVKTEVEKLLAEKSKLEHKIKSDEGRVAAYQRHFETARQELEAVRKAAQSNQSKQPPQTAAAQQGQQQSNQKVIPPEIQAILDVDETLGKALLKTYEENERTKSALEQELRSLREEAINPLAERQEELYLQQELDLLEREMPGALDVLRHDIWQDFKSVAPSHILRLATSKDRKEVATALQEYSLWIARSDVQEWANKKYGAPQQQQPAKTVEQVQQPARQPDPQQVAQAQKVKAAAERKAQASPVASSTVGRPATKKLTFDDVLNDPVKLKEWHDRQFEEELAKIEGRKPKHKQ